MINTATLYSDNSLLINGKFVGILKIKTKSGVYQNATNMNAHLGETVIFKSVGGRIEEIIIPVSYYPDDYLTGNKIEGLQHEEEFVEAVLKALS